MEVILTHENADFDALAAMLAAAKLYPGAIAVLPRKLNRNVRAFVTLYGEQLPFTAPDGIPKGRINRVILVDTQGVVQHKGMHRHTQVHIIDHHPLTRELVPGMTYQGGEDGATTTLLVQELCERPTTLTPIEATLLLLGIYEDTGSLSYTGTTPADIQCAAWLLERGASLAVVNNFLHHPLTLEQRELYETLLDSVKSRDFVGHSVIIATAQVEQQVEEIATLAHKLMDLFDPEAAFVLVQWNNQLQLVARSTTEAIDVAAIVAHFGGGGHSKAAAALIRDGDLVAVRDKLVRILQSEVQPTVTVRQIMSFGARTISPETTVAEAEALMRRYGHEGFPVVDDDRLIGILTRGEIDKAMHHQLGDRPIRAYMHTGAVSVSPDDSVTRVQQVMIEHGVGQVPVVEEGRITGIVTRTDLIKLWGTPPRAPRAAEMAERIRQVVPSNLLDLLCRAGEAATELSFSIFLVGGFVRDLLLGIPNLDIDLVVEGDAIALARRLARESGGRVHGHTRFGTAKWMLTRTDLPVTSLDFTTARSEVYEHPTALPQVEHSSIKQDLHRRDFTINTLAICLNKDSYGELLDFYGGERDLERRLIRVLHNLSFVEDPTRILRAVRLEQRLGFTIEPRTAELIADALPLLDRVSGERIRNELALILQEDAPEKALKRLGDLGVLTRLHPALRFDSWVETRFEIFRQVAPEWDHAEKSPLPRGHKPGTPGPYALGLALLTYRLGPKDVERLIRRLRIPKREGDLLRESPRLQAVLPDLAKPDLAPSAIYRLLEPYSSEALLVARVASDEPIVCERIELFHRQLRSVKPLIDGHRLQAMGVEPGPMYRRILGTLRDARLDGRIATLAEEEAIAKRLLADAALAPTS
jgi:tRNA nucleotidyltransferase (CCA-adding enzyme)